MPMHRTSSNYIKNAENIPNEWLDVLKKEHLASVALKGPSVFLINNILQYSRQLVAIHSISTILVNLN
jgi:hypothetical protein